ncbi:tetratricopeptide repeat protein 19, mitochondrial [Discoglossus pictus]
MALSRLCILCFGSLSDVIRRSGSLRSIQTAHRALSHRTTCPQLKYTSATALCLVTADTYGRSQDRKTSLVPLVTIAAFSLFSKSTDKEQEEDNTVTEEHIIYMLKKAKLNIMKGEMDEAETLLHQALQMAQQSDSRRAVTYTYDLMANLAFLRGQLDRAEKLFKATMISMLEGGANQDDNSFLEISLKLASIYAAQNQDELAVAGFQFCIMSLEEKIEKEKHLLEEVLTAEDKSNTRLLLGLCLDSYGRYLLANSQLSLAQNMYEKALKICKEEQGEQHPHTVTLMNDLATVLDAQGRYDEAYTMVNQALELAHQTEHPDQHVVLSNKAVILMYQGTEHLEDAERIFMEALKQAEEKKDTASIQYIQEGLSELGRRKEKDVKTQ